MTATTVSPYLHPPYRKGSRGGCLPLLLACAALGCISVLGEPTWDMGEGAGCSYIFGCSIRERSRRGQVDPLLIWLGKPSEALQVSSKHGRLPIVSLWRSYVNVLYLTQCPGQESEQQGQFDASAVASFMTHWTERNPSFRHRSLYLSGANGAGGAGSDHSTAFSDHSDQPSQLAAAAVALIGAGFTVDGVLIGNPEQTPSIRFFGHRPFETGNQMNEYAISRAANPVVCNARYSQVEFVMNDAVFYYSPNTRARRPDETQRAAVAEMHEYSLTGVSSYDTCYKDLSQFKQDWSNRSPYLTEIFPALPQSDPQTSPLFPPCDFTETSADLTLLLGLNLTVFMYSFIYKDVKPTCSFYIGIFEADGMRIPGYDDIALDQGQSQLLVDDVSSRRKLAISSFNLATTVSIEDSWTRYADEHTVSDRDTYTQLGQIQDAASSYGFSKAEGGDSQRFIYMHLDSRMDLKQKTELLMLSKMTAVDVLSRLMNKDVDVEYVELFI
jgi:hypothetical protein